jgi:CheY-like chemotaxis protein
MPGHLPRRTAAGERPRPSRVRVTLEVEFASREDLARAMVGGSLDAGLLIATDTPLPVGLHTELSVSFPGIEAPLMLEGEVCWSTRGDDAGMRIALTEVPRELRELRRSGSQTISQTVLSVPKEGANPPPRIVVLESNPVLRDLLQYAFQSVVARRALPNANAEFTSSVAKCRAMLEAGTTLLVVDIDSVHAGFELVAQLRKSDQFAGVPILAVTAGAAPPSDDLTMVLRKPIALDQLLKSAELLIAAARRAG